MFDGLIDMLWFGLLYFYTALYIYVYYTATVAYRTVDLLTISRLTWLYCSQSLGVVVISPLWRYGDFIRGLNYNFIRVCFATVGEIKVFSNTFHSGIQKPISSPDEMFSSANESFVTHDIPPTVYLLLLKFIIHYIIANVWNYCVAEKLLAIVVKNNMSRY